MTNKEIIQISKSKPKIISILCTFNIYLEYHSVCPLVRLVAPSLASESFSPPEPKGGAHSPAGEWDGGCPNSDDWRKGLAHCLLCGLHKPATPQKAARIKRAVLWVSLDSL